jgi:hypothetical protein
MVIKLPAASPGVWREWNLTGLSAITSLKTFETTLFLTGKSNN